MVVVQPRLITADTENEFTARRYWLYSPALSTGANSFLKNKSNGGKPLGLCATHRISRFAKVPIPDDQVVMALVTT